MNNQYTEEMLVVANNKSDPTPAKIQAYLQSNWDALTTSYKRLWRDRMSTLITLVVIGIAFALPTSLFVLIQNAKAISQNWQEGSQITLYLKTAITPTQTQTLINRLDKQLGIASVKYISPAQGLAQLQNQPDLKNALATLDDNPLPGVLLIEPDTSLHSPEEINELLQQLQKLPQVDIAQLDMQWVQRLYAIIDLGKHLVYALGFLLSVGILFIIGNTIHLALQKYHHEIEVFKLVGATNAYIRRPFLYLGIFYGLFGSIIAWFFILFLLAWLAPPIHKLTNLYHSDFHLFGMSLSIGFNLMLLGILLGLVGAWFAVRKYIKE